MRVENKMFYFDVGQNRRGVFMRISEVSSCACVTPVVIFIHNYRPRLSIRLSVHGGGGGGGSRGDPTWPGGCPDRRGYPGQVQLGGTPPPPSRGIPQQGTPPPIQDNKWST